MLARTLQALTLVAYLAFWSTALPSSAPPLTDQIEQIRAYTRNLEFDYLTWTFDAAFVKLQAASVGLPYLLPRVTQQQIVLDYLALTQQGLEQEYALEELYADPSVTDKESSSAALRAELAALTSRKQELAPLAESILQEQLGQVLAELGLTTLGQPIPNVLFHITPLPMALIVSRRDRVEEIANISVETEMTLDEQAALENRIDRGLDVSSLVVPIGGVGVYPTMVTRTADLRWLAETISHEWTHNYLTLRPLGFLYDSTPELRTMNETAASISGTEVSSRLLERFYPELLTDTASADQLVSVPADHPDPGDLPRPVFDFRAEMHTTRVTVDALLSGGKIEKAEAYLEARRLIFLQHGYLLRKLNQAYFAFYGAYADVPGGAAGEDPVGPAVRLLRQQSDSLADFINRISWMTTFEQLKAAVSP